MSGYTDADAEGVLGQRVTVKHGRSSTEGVVLHLTVSAATGRKTDGLLIREDDGVARVIAYTDIKSVGLHGDRDIAAGDSGSTNDTQV